ncbi:MAG: efflux RND transporter periplasmic adaptor subunit [Verrucomicrobiota bacterium]|nr:efflux RND transporter periplasmic adaptor subunit [Verrucomicrobiota bacterium]
MKRAVLIIVAVLLIVAAWRLWPGRGGSDSGYQTAVITRGSVTQAVTATGTLNPVVNVQVGSQVSGNIQKLFADFNSPVKAGQVVAQIDPTLFQASVTQAEGELASAQAALELARLNATRTQSLFAKQNSAQADVDQAQASLHQAEANVRIKQGALDRVRADLDHCAIKSPVDGTVISRNVDVGQTVAASLQAPVIFTIANDLTKMQIDAAVAEADVGAIAVDLPVDFTVDAFPNRTFHGKVVQVRNAPTTVQNVVSYDTVIGVDNSELKLKPGMTANVSIIIAQRPDVLKIANAALRYRPADATPPPAQRSPGGSPAGAGAGGSGPRGGGAPRGGGPPGAGEHRSERTVYVLRGSKPEPAQIKTGISDGVATELLEGLNENDRVVTGQLNAGGAAAAQGNPFGGGRRGF